VLAVVTHFSAMVPSGALAMSATGRYTLPSTLNCERETHAQPLMLRTE
jgi:hypothetical protein